MARPTKFTPERQKKIVEAVRMGNFPETAARAAGISPATYYRWRQRGLEEEEGIFADFVAAIDEAEAQAEIEAVNFLVFCASKGWRANAYFLERRWRARCGPAAASNPVEDVKPAGEAGPTLDLSRLTDEQLDSLRDLLHRAAGVAEPDPLADGTSAKPTPEAGSAYHE